MRVNDVRLNSPRTLARPGFCAFGRQQSGPLERVGLDVGDLARRDQCAIRRRVGHGRDRRRAPLERPGLGHYGDCGRDGRRRSPTRWRECRERRRGLCDHRRRRGVVVQRHRLESGRRRDDRSAGKRVAVQRRYFGSAVLVASVIVARAAKAPCHNPGHSRVPYLKSNQHDYSLQPVRMHVCAILEGVGGSRDRRRSPGGRGRRHRPSG